MDKDNIAQRILYKIEDRLPKMDGVDHDNIFNQDMGLLIHFFQHPRNVSPSSPFSLRPNICGLICDDEVTVEKVKAFVNEHNAKQQKREKKRNSSIYSGHVPEKQTSTGTIEPFVRFDVYEKLLNDNPELCQADNFITKLLYSEAISSMEDKLDQYIREHPSLKWD